MKYRIEIPKLPPKSSAHHMVLHRAKKEWAQAFYILGVMAQQIPLCAVGEFRKVSIIFESPGPKRDKDNLYTLCKVPLDALKRADLINDDSPRHILLEADDVSAGKSRTIIWIETDYTESGMVDE